MTPEEIKKKFDDLEDSSDQVYDCYQIVSLLLATLKQPLKTCLCPHPDHVSEYNQAVTQFNEKIDKYLYAIR